MYKPDFRHKTHFLIIVSLSILKIGQHVNKVLNTFSYVIKVQPKFLLQILKYFDKGKCWEKGIPLCKELAVLYETKRFDYNKLSDILILEAKFFQNILTQLRPEPEYFRVGFYGMGFPLFVRVRLRKLVS